MVETFKYLLEGFFLGIATGPLCLASCGLIYASFLMQKDLSYKRYITDLLQLSVGRFITYVFVGAISGSFGSHVSHIYREYLSLAAYLLFSIFLVLSFFRGQSCEKGCKVSRWSKFAEWPIVLGMITGINICPTFLIAFTRSFQLSGPVAGAQFFASFFAGTTLFLLPLSLIGMLGKQYIFRKIARVSAICIVCWFLFNSVKISYGLVQPYFDKRPVISLMDETPLYVIFREKTKAEEAAIALCANRKGPVHLASPSDSLPQICYIITEQANLINGYGEPYRKPDRFVAVIDENYLNGSLGFNEIVSFLTRFHFRFNKAEGEIFYLR